MRLIDATAAAAALPFGALIAALRTRFIEGCEVPLRHGHAIPAADPAAGAAGTLLLMPAWRPGRRIVVKLVSVFPGNAARGLPALHSVVLLLDAGNGKPLAMIDGDTITSRRTAAASALAASLLARPDASRLLVVGAGRVAALMPAAMRAVRPVRQVSVWARRPNAAQALADQLAADGFDAQACTELEQAARAAHIVSCATLSTEPLISGHWLQAGTHLDLVGGFTPQMREADAACFAGARVVVDTLEATVKSGDWLQAAAAGTVDPGPPSTLADLCRGAASGREHEGERTLFKSVGTALEDLAAAELAFDGAAAVPGCDDGSGDIR